jgi:1,4-alpha-glucan branching enzyme
VGTYAEFTANVLPRVVAAGYNTLQIMACARAPYYGSFGYHVSSFFAASSRFGTPEELKALIDSGACRRPAGAHRPGSFACRQQRSGGHQPVGRQRIPVLPRGPAGRHQAWDSRLFDYAKPEVLHFLLSNCRFWLDEFRVDGFRFDGITSMLYLDHGLGKAFTATTITSTATWMKTPCAIWRWPTR